MKTIIQKEDSFFKKHRPTKLIKSMGLTLGIIAMTFGVNVASAKDGPGRQSTDKPNIIIILADDFGVENPAIYGEGVSYTKH